MSSWWDNKKRRQCRTDWEQIHRLAAVGGRTLRELSDEYHVPYGTSLNRSYRCGRPVNPLFIFPPDNRRVFSDTTYPWRVCGRVVTAVATPADAREALSLKGSDRVAF
jgi:hypothetical protein